MTFFCGLQKQFYIHLPLTTQFWHLRKPSGSEKVINWSRNNPKILYSSRQLRLKVEIPADYNPWLLKIENKKLLHALNLVNAVCLICCLFFTKMKKIPVLVVLIPITLGGIHWYCIYIQTKQ